MKSPSALVQALLIALLCLIWGSTWSAVKEGMSTVPAYLTLASRFTLAAFGMTLLTAWLGPRERAEKPPLRLSVITGLTQFSLSYLLVYGCTPHLPSGMVCVLWSTYPLFVAVGAHLFLPEERLGRGQAIGLAVGFLGVVALYITDLEQLGQDARWAALALLGSPLIVSVGTVLIKREGGRYAALPMTRNALWISSLVLWPAAWLETRGEGVDWLAVWDVRSLGFVSYLALIGTVLAFGVYFWLLRWAPATRLALITYVTPPIALGIDAVLLKEPLTGTKIVGTLLILSGVALSSRRKRGRLPEGTGPSD